jgi:hypothetical protein
MFKISIRPFKKFAAMQTVLKSFKRFSFEVELFPAFAVQRMVISNERRPQSRPGFPERSPTAEAEGAKTASWGFPYFLPHSSGPSVRKSRVIPVSSFRPYGKREDGREMIGTASNDEEMKT